ncbi:MAG: AbrB family transcriptional regulator [Acidimicrobiales bacterium]|nr:MAG: AbrB family transcriptional regulator [Acidimicrobiales bacterium]
MTAAHAFELPAQGGGVMLPDSEVTAVEEDGEVIYLTRRGRAVARIVPVDPEQAWFWSPQWQTKEHEADSDIAAGRGKVYYSDEEFLAALEASVKTGKL